MDYASFLHYISSCKDPVILVEGTRNLPDADRPALLRLAEMLAGRLPRAIFRTGNATGSDEAFAEGVCRVDASRLQYILPSSGMGNSRKNPSAYSVAVENISSVEEPELVYRTKQATPANARLIDRFVQREKGQAYAKSLYLLRDTLKVTGSAEQGLAPASLGIFYVDRSREGGGGGGTGHTLRVCEQAGVPVILQEEWMQWLRENVQ